MDFVSLMMEHIERCGNHDLYQELFNMLDDFCVEHGYFRPTAETILSIYGVLIINRRIEKNVK